MSRGSVYKTNDENVDFILRPKNWESYIGQERIKKSLRIMLTAAKKRNEASDHLLFCGQAGLGKTTLATLVAAEMNANLKVINGPTIEKTGDIIAILSNLEPSDVVFIDEAHRLPAPVEEVLYPAMEERKARVIIGRGPAARVISLNLPPFTLIAATTRTSLISPALRSRFGAIFRLEYYGLDEIEEIIRRSAGILGVKIEPEAASLLAKISRFTPRIANRLLKRCRDFAEVNNLRKIESGAVSKTLDLLGIDEFGLEPFDRKLLTTIIDKFAGGPVGISALSAALGEEKDAIEEVYEPYLIKIGFLNRTPKGRMTTKEARKRLKNGN
jgi:Holliday junction DNA helicase RuvB